MEKKTTLIVTCVLMLLFSSACRQAAPAPSGSGELSDSGIAVTDIPNTTASANTTTKALTTSQTVSTTVPSTAPTASPTRAQLLDWSVADTKKFGEDLTTSERASGYLIRSFSELQAFVTSQKEEASQLGDYADVRNKALVKSFEKYTETYFADKALVLVYTRLSGSTQSAEIQSMSVDGTALKVKVCFTTKVGVSGNSAVSYEWRFVELSRDALKGATQIEVQSENLCVRATKP